MFGMVEYIVIDCLDLWNSIS